jgi:hypothetical protein
VLAQAFSTSERMGAKTHRGASSRRQPAVRARRQARPVDRRPCAIYVPGTRGVLSLPVVVTASASELPTIGVVRVCRLLSIPVAWRV